MLLVTNCAVYLVELRIYSYIDKLRRDHGEEEESETLPQKELE